jgi:hypothetical protein
MGFVWVAVGGAGTKEYEEKQPASQKHVGRIIYIMLNNIVTFKQIVKAYLSRVLRE